MSSIQNNRLVDILPPNMNDVNIKALAHAIDKEHLKLVKYINTVIILGEIDSVSEKTLDHMAINLKAKCYDDSLPYEKKLNLFKENIYRSKFTLGTANTLNRIMSVLYGGSKVVEWFDAGFDPFTFKIHIQAPEIADENSLSAIYKDIVSKVEESKNARSHLTGIMLFLQSNATIYTATHHSVSNHIKILPYIPVDIKTLSNIVPGMFTKYVTIIKIKPKIGGQQ